MKHMLKEAGGLESRGGLSTGGVGTAQVGPSSELQSQVQIAQTQGKASWVLAEKFLW